MPFFINRKIKTSLEIKDITKKIEEEAARYIKHTSEYNEIGYVFLKSVLYIEDLIIGINKAIYGADSKDGTLGYQINKIKIIKNCKELEKSLNLLDQIKKYRNEIAHTLTYKPEEDSDFLKDFNIDTNDNIIIKKYKIGIYFQDIIGGILYVKIGLEYIDNFIFYKSK